MKQVLFTDYLVAVVNGEQPDIAPGQGVFLIAVLISGVAGYDTFVIDFLNDGIFCRLLQVLILSAGKLAKYTKEQAQKEKLLLFLIICTGGFLEKFAILQRCAQ